jgi:ubiquitin-conjugating enzyme E2 J2
MSKKGAIARLRKELKAISNDPCPYIHVAVSDSNFLNWSFLLEGPPDTPYVGGWYWGRIRFPAEYPFKPPSILMVTPSGRFRPDTRLCLSMSDFHPESWNPSWSLSTVLTGLLSFMVESTPTTGAVESTEADKLAFAGQVPRPHPRPRLFSPAVGGTAHSNCLSVTGVGRSRWRGTKRKRSS